MKQASLVALTGLTVALTALILGGLGVGVAGAAAAPNQIAITVTESAYEPDRVEAVKDQALTLVFTRTSEGTCGAILSVPDFGIKKDLPVNTPVEITITPKKTGEITFMCGMKMMKGHIVVK